MLTKPVTLYPVLEEGHEYGNDSLKMIWEKASRSTATLRDMFGNKPKLKVARRPGALSGMLIPLERANDLRTIDIDGNYVLYVRYDGRLCEARLRGFPSRCGRDFSKVRLEIDVPVDRPAPRTTTPALASASS